MNSAICVLLGHADAGKTSILDAIRETLFAYKESGGLTQNIGATEVPIERINTIAKPLLESMKIKIEIPSIIFIDSPGHESFITLREKGASVADITILVVDINEGIQDQTRESLNILRKYKTPFLVALTKIDTLQGFIEVESSNIKEFLEKQNKRFLDQFYTRLYTIQGQLSELGFQSDLYYQISDFTKTVSIVPVSSKFKVGIADLLVLLIGLVQKFKLNERPKDSRIFFLECRTEKGIGNVVDSIVYSGSVKVGDVISFVSEGKIVEDSVKAIFKPEELSETREKFGKFHSVSNIEGTSVARLVFKKFVPTPGTFGIVGESQEIKEELNKISLSKYDPQGIVICADTVGSIEAIRRLLEARNLGIAREKIGPPTKEDVLAAVGSKILLAFNVEVSNEIQQYSLEKGCKIIHSNSIYRIMEDLDNTLEEMRKEEWNTLITTYIFPGKIEVLNGYIFRRSKPAVFGIRVLEGVIAKGYPLIRADGKYIGNIIDIQDNKKSLNAAEKGKEVAISVDAQVGKDFNEGDILYTKPSLESIMKLEEIREKLPVEYRNLLDEIRKIIKL